MGYPRLSVIEYVFTLLNSNYEEWRRGNGDKSWEEFPFSVKKMSVSGALFDFDKLNDVSKNVISRMTAEEVYDGVLAWAKEYDGEFAALLSAQPETAKAAFAIGRGGNKPRKDLTVWADAKEYRDFSSIHFTESRILTQMPSKNPTFGQPWKHLWPPTTLATINRPGLIK